MKSKQILKTPSPHLPHLPAPNFTLIFSTFPAAPSFSGEVLLVLFSYFNVVLPTGDRPAWASPTWILPTGLPPVWCNPSGMHCSRAGCPWSHTSCSHVGSIFHCSTGPAWSLLQCRLVINSLLQTLTCSLVNLPRAAGSRLPLDDLHISGAPPAPPALTLVSAGLLL